MLRKYLKQPFSRYCRYAITFFRIFYTKNVFLAEIITVTNFQEEIFYEGKEKVVNESHKAIYDTNPLSKFASHT